MANPVDEIKNRLQTALRRRNMKPVELSEKTKIPKSSISQYMSGYAKPNGERIFLICKALEINEAWFLGYDAPMEIKNNPTQITADSFPSPNITDDYVTFPVMGEIVAGYDNIAVENWEGEEIDIPVSHLKGRPQSDYFVLNVKGDSMYPLYHNNDKVLILKQSTMDNSGDIGAVIYDDEYATLKKVEYKQGENWVRLVPVNPEYQPKTITDEQLEHCRVIGVPKLLIREIII